MTYSGKFYKCNIAVTTPEAFNINKWNDVTASEVFSSRLIKTIVADGVKTTLEIMNEILNDVTLNDLSYIKINDYVYRYNGETFSNFAIGASSSNVFINVYSTSHCRQVKIATDGTVSSSSYDSYVQPSGTIFELHS